LTYDGSKKLMARSRNISSSPNKRMFLSGDIILQIKREDNVRHTTDIIESMHNIDASGQLTQSQTMSSSVS